MLKYGLHILIALAGLLLQSTLFARVSADALKPDIAFLVVVYLGLHRPTGEATPAIVVIGYLADLFSGLPNGAFLLVYLCAFYLAAGAARIFYFRGTGFPAVSVFFLSLAYGVTIDLMVSYGKAVEEEVTTTLSSGHSFAFLLLFAIVNLLFSLPLYRMSRAVDGGNDLRSGQRAKFS